MSSFIGFKTKDGKEHVGWYHPNLNPMYHDIYGQDYDEIESSFEVQYFDCFYWDAEQEAYLPLPFPMDAEKSSGLKLMNRDYRKELIENAETSKTYLRQMIREWLLLRAKCQAGVYIEKDFSIRSDGPILIDALQTIPDYIHFVSK